MASLELKNVWKKYDGGVEAVKDFNLEIEDKEFVIFVGPSGCGKSTTLPLNRGDLQKCRFSSMIKRNRETKQQPPTL